MSVRAFTALSAGFATLLLSGAALAQSAPPRPTDVDAVTVLASPDVRLTVAVGGDMAAETFVTSAPVGLNCGGASSRYDHKANHQCWLWVRRNRPVMLTAQASGRFGADWSVQWVGCEPVANGAACQLSPKEEAQVAAVFTRLNP